MNENPPEGWTNMDLYWPGDPRAMVGKLTGYELAWQRQAAKDYRGPDVTPKRKAPSRRKGLKREVRGSCVVLSLRDPKAWRRR